MPVKPTYNETAVMADFRLGKEDAFGKIFHELYPALCFYGLQVTGNQAAAEDIVAASFLKVWEKRVLFEHWNALKSYLYTTVRHAGIDWLRKERRVQISGNDFTNTVQAEDRIVLENIIEAELLREIYAAIDKLPAQCRKVIEMIYVEGKTSTEIAGELQLSISSIRNQKARGLGILRKLVQLPVLLTLLLHII